MMLFLSFAIPLLAGFAFASFFCPKLRPLRSHFFFEGWLAVGVGFGISSLVFFLWSVVFHPARPGLIAGEVLFLLGLTAIFLHRIKGRRCVGAVAIPSESISKSLTERLLLVSFCSALVSALLAFMLFSLARPQGAWDAWAIWNLRARFIFRGAEGWTSAFSPLLAWSHPDYPLLIPALIARSWGYVGRETPMAPALTSMFFTFATVGLLFSSLSILRSRGQGFLAALVLLGTPSFIEQGASQLADVPLSFFFLATVVLFCLHERFLPGGYGLLFLAGMAVGLSAWTKNEGLLFVLSVSFSHFVLALGRQGWRAYLREALPFASGLLPAGIVLFYFKTQMAPPGDLLFLSGFEASLERLRDFSRYGELLKGFAVGITRFGQWSVSAPLLLIAYFFVVGIESRARQFRASAVSLAALLLQGAGYLFAYAMTPYDLQWHLATSLSRLFLHLWPGFLFVFFLLVRTPEEAATRGP